MKASKQAGKEASKQARHKERQKIRRNKTKRQAQVAANNDLGYANMYSWSREKTKDEER